MATTLATRVLNVAALGFPVHGLPGPALLGESGAQIVMLVSGDDGEPVSHLPAAAFNVRALVTRAGRSGGAVEARMCPLGVPSFSEPDPGLYVLSVRELNNSALERGTHVVLVSIVDGRGTAGRTIVRVDV